MGSSPLARGLPDVSDDDVPDSRIIPARAGFTSKVSFAPLPTGDHPRSRGVYISAIRDQTERPGSSPLARGLRIDALVDLLLAGIIPARAGFTET